MVGGLLDIIRQYYSPASDAYRILVAHSYDVAQMAVDIAKAYPHINVDVRFVEEAAMLHDIGIFMTNAPGIDCHGTEPYIKHGYLGAELLRSIGLPHHALVAERHTGSGLTMREIHAREIDIPDGIYYPVSIEEKIVCYADKFFSKTKLGKRKSIERVRASVAKHGQDALLRFEALHAELMLYREV